MMIQSFDFSIDLMRAILWQYDGAKRLAAIIRAEEDWLNENNRDFWEGWYRDVFDIETANDFGLAVWARILNINTGFSVEASTSKAAFGFGSNHQNFENGNFARAREGEIQLSTSQKRLVIKLRYRQLTTRPTLAGVNKVLADVFGSMGKVYVFDVLNMTQIVFFSFEPDSDLRLILEQFDILPRPSTVESKWQVQIGPAFGFGVEHLNFENGNFGG